LAAGIPQRIGGLLGEGFIGMLPQPSIGALIPPGHASHDDYLLIVQHEVDDPVVANPQTVRARPRHLDRPASCRSWVLGESLDADQNPGLILAR
jgi:hypothetical protein